jgi:hypothetical protein
MSTLTNSLFLHSLLFKYIYYFLIFLYYFLFLVFIHHQSKAFPNTHLAYEPLPLLLGMVVITSHALLDQSSREIHLGSCSLGLKSVGGKKDSIKIITISIMLRNENELR